VNDPLFIGSRQPDSLTLNMLIDGDPIANVFDFDKLRRDSYVIHHIGDIKDADLHDIALYDRNRRIG